MKRLIGAMGVFAACWSITACGSADPSESGEISSEPQLGGVHLLVTDGDPGSACPAPTTYTMNRLYVGNADGEYGRWMDGCPCVTTRGQPGRLSWKCGVAPSTCGYLYCIAY